MLLLAVESSSPSPSWLSLSAFAGTETAAGVAALAAKADISGFSSIFVV